MTLYLTSLKLRRNTKPQRVRTNKRILGTNIQEQLEIIDSREEFGLRRSILSLAQKIRMIVFYLL